LEIKKTEKLDAIKDYLKAEIYQELKNEIRKEVADEFEQRFIGVLDMHIQQVLLNQVSVELDITDRGISSRLLLGYQSGKPVFNAYHYKLQEIIDKVKP
jgi:N-acetylglutamate synthase-like GNAT family acetyltransferase